MKRKVSIFISVLVLSIMLVNLVEAEEFIEVGIHEAYIEGISNILFFPEQYIYREEAAEIIFNAFELGSEYGNKGFEKSFFDDVAIEDEYSLYINALVERGILKGDGNGEFRPKEELRVGEIKHLINQIIDSNFKTLNREEFEKLFVEKYVGKMDNYDIVVKTYKEDDKVSRGPFVAIMNTILDRKSKLEDMNRLMVEFIDVPNFKWYCDDVLEAANSHIYEVVNGIEKWYK